MRRVAVLLTTLALSACAMAPTGIFARVEVGCAKQTLIFSNPEKIDEKITVKATDTCQGTDSEIQLLDTDSKVLQRFRIPDGATETIHVTVRAGEWLNFVCEGKGGSCAYSVGAD